MLLKAVFNMLEEMKQCSLPGCGCFIVVFLWGSGELSVLAESTYGGLLCFGHE